MSGSDDSKRWELNSRQQIAPHRLQLGHEGNTHSTSVLEIVHAFPAYHQHDSVRVGLSRDCMRTRTITEASGFWDRSALYVQVHSTAARDTVLCSSLRACDGRIGHTFHPPEDPDSGCVRPGGADSLLQFLMPDSDVGPSSRL
ncbi:hypothetical protein AXG93_1513s1010 [Marchantia polymorpha subsp. ruderalis]|uniref:Uncharacterized protein n=1 Tax=Marchantia polymorpha subsp. ruderalis TaxID=1480154 RepID=A0A176WC10_MARPO|nr:hypothetical protein AXG93_1513s1010 [Marchantia polymorpha subsp. ruderalis]